MNDSCTNMQIDLEPKPSAPHAADNQACHLQSAILSGNPEGLQ